MDIPKDVHHSITEMVKLFYQLRKQGKNPELEARVGRLVKCPSNHGKPNHNKIRFEPGLGGSKQMILKFNKAMKATKTSPAKNRWTHEHSIIKIESLYPNNIRSIVKPPPKGKKTKKFTIWEEKIRVRDVDVSVTNRVHDLRFSLSIETKLSADHPKVKKCRTKKADRFKMITEVSSLLKGCAVSREDRIGIRFDVRKVAEAESKRRLFDIDCNYHIEIELDQDYCKLDNPNYAGVAAQLIYKACETLGNYELKDGESVPLPRPLIRLRIKNKGS